MARYSYVIYSDILKIYCIKVHYDDDDIDPNNISIINKFKNMKYYKETKNDIYKLFNSHDVSQLYLTDKTTTSKNDVTPADFKKQIHKLIKKEYDDNNTTFIEKKIINKLRGFKNYTLLDNINETNTKEYQRIRRLKQKNITEKEIETIKNKINNIKENNSTNILITNKLIELINENKNNRYIINQFIDDKIKKSIRNKITITNRNLAN